MSDENITHKLEKDKLYYLAHPYAASTKFEEKLNFEKCVKITNDLLDKGFRIYSPIAMSHPLHIKKHRNVNFWYDYSVFMLEKCDALILAGDWIASKGCRLEKEFAKKFDMEIYLIEGIL